MHLFRVFFEFLGKILSFIFNNIFHKIFEILLCSINSSNFKRSLKKHGKRINIGRHNKFENLKNVIIGNDFSSLDGLWIGAYNYYFQFEYHPNIIIGNNVHFSRNCHVGAIDSVIIDDNVLIGSNVLINDHSHGQTNNFSMPRFKLELVSNGPIHIGENCFLCDNCCILGGVTLGKNCIVAANSVVNKSFPDNCLIAGSPAKLVKKLNEN